jgi:hypothetical protein
VRGGGVIRNILWVLAAFCSIMALMASLTTYAPPGLVNGMKTEIALSAVAIICATIAAFMRPRRVFGFVAGGIIAIFNVHSIIESAMVIAWH